MPSGGIDYSKWDKLQLRSEEEQQQQHAPPPRAAGRTGGQKTTAAAAAAAAPPNIDDLSSGPSQQSTTSVLPASKLTYRKTSPSAVDLENIAAGESEIKFFSTAAEFQQHTVVLEQEGTLAVSTQEKERTEEKPFRETGEIYGRGDLTGLILVPAEETLFVMDQSKLMRKNDGSLLYGNLEVTTFPCPPRFTITVVACLFAITVAPRRISAAIPSFRNSSRNWWMTLLQILKRIWRTTKRIRWKKKRAAVPNKISWKTACTASCRNTIVLCYMRPRRSVDTLLHGLEGLLGH